MNTQSQVLWDIGIENLCAGYKDKTIVKSMNAHIPAQKITAVLGAFGCKNNNPQKFFLGFLESNLENFILGIMI